jgi:putative flippase GtrA
MPLRTSGAAFVARVRRGLGELARFFTVGLLAYVVDVGTFNLLVHAGGEGVLFDKPLTAKVIAVVAATVVAYFGNRQWTWRDRERRGFWREYGLFFVLNAIALALTLLPLAFSRYVLGLDSALADNLSGNVVGVALGTAFRFWSYRTWVFPKTPSATAVD